MADNNLAVKITADIVDMQTKFAVAQATVRGLSSEMSKLATQSAKGLIDPAGSARLQQVAGDLLHARGAASEFASKLQAAGVSVGGFGNRVKSETQGVGGAFESMAGNVNAALKFTGIGIAIEGLHKLIDVVGEASQRANEIRNMSEVLGVTATQFQAMGVAAEEAGIGSEQMFRGVEKLVLVLDKARDGSGAEIEKLKALGLSNDQIRDKSFGAAQMIAFLSGRLNDASTHAETLKAISEVLGAKAVLAAGGIKQLGSDLDGWAQKAAEVNALNDYELSRLHEVGASWDKTGMAIKAASEKAVVWSADNIGVLKTLSAAIPQLGLLASAFEHLTGASGDAAAGGHVEGKIDRSGTADAQASAQAASQAAAKAGNSAITKDTLDSIKDQIEATKQGSAERLALVRQFYTDSLAFYANDPTVDKVKEAHRQLVAEQRAHGEELLREAQKNAADLVTATREKASEIMAEEGVSKAQQLAQVRDLYAEELQSATLTKEKRLEVERSLNEAITAVHREAASTAQAIARSDADTGIAIARLTLAAQKQVLDEELAAHQINAAQKLAILRQFAAEEFSITLKGLNDELIQLENQPDKYREVYNQIRELKAKLALDMAALDRQYAADARRAAQDEATAWKGAVSEIEGAENTMIGDLLSGRKSFAASAISAGEQLATKEIEDTARAVTTRLLLGNTEEAQKKAMEQGGVLYHLFAEGQKTAATGAGTTARTSTQVTGEATGKALDATGAAAHTVAEGAKTAATATGVAARNTAGATENAGLFARIGAAIASWFGGETSKTGATTAGATTRTTEQATADATAMAAQKVTALSEINASAAVGAAAAGASVAAIPVYGWAMAGPTAAATYGELAAYASALSFDRGAWNIPSDMHGVTVHQGETILPRPFAEEFRANGGGLGGGHGGGDTYGDTNINNHFHEVHPSTDQIMAHFSKAVRNGHPALRGR